MGPFGVVGPNARVAALHEKARRVAQSDAAVLIRGDSGTGKEVVARAIHALGPRRGSRFVAINCTTLPDGVLESELFGHVDGAFTGAEGNRGGLFEAADGGTLLLDEIGDMPFLLQAKLLRVLETHEIRAVGADVARTVDVRIIAATHQPIEERVRDGQFREDLFYRLSVVPLVVPPLRERRDDIPILVAQFLASARARNPMSEVVTFTDAAMHRLQSYDWPGNVRELKNLVERLVVVGCRPEVTEVELGAQLAPAPAPRTPSFVDADHIVSLHDLEDEYIAWVIGQCDGNKTRAAELLGIDVSTVHRRRRAPSRSK